MYFVSSERLGRVHHGTMATLLNRPAISFPVITDQRSEGVASFYKQDAQDGPDQTIIH